jgi:AcrR family transcriptional regulator
MTGQQQQQRQRQQRTTTEPATRRRADELVGAIRVAVRAELKDHGYDGLTFEGVARRAGTSKPVLYRRYRSRAHLALDSVTTMLSENLPPIDSGELRTDLITFLDTLAGRFHSIGIDAFRGIVGESDDELAARLTELSHQAARTTVRGIIDAARERGELGRAPLDDRVLVLPIAMLRNELLFTRPLDPNGIPEMIDLVYVPLLRQVTGHP